MASDLKTLIDRFYADVWERIDEAAARQILHPDLAFRGSLGPSFKGVDGFLEYVRSIHAALAGYRCIVEDLVVSGDRAAARLRFVGTHRGPFFGVAATGKEIAWAGGVFFAMADGKISEIWALGDIDSVKRQLGVGAATTFRK